MIEPFGASSSLQPGRPRRAITNDGRSVFFIKRDVLAPGAVEGQRNLYEWHDGQIAFLGTSLELHNAPGTPFTSAGTELAFAGTSADGGDVFFVSRDRLSWQDHDSRNDLYNARVGGGFSEPPPAPEPCEGDACQGSASGSPAERAIGSVGFTDGNLSEEGETSVASVRVSALRAVRGYARRLRVRVPSAGRITVRGPLVRSGRVDASKKGSYTLRVALKAKARKKLRRRGSLTVGATVAFRSADDGSASRAIRITFRSPKPRSAKAKKGGRR